MDSAMDKNTAHIAQSSSDKVISLFSFIKDLSASKQTMIWNVEKHNWYQAIERIHDDPENIKLFYRDRVEEEDTDLSADLLRVHKPEFQQCPQPDPVLNKWLKKDWDLWYKDAAVEDSIEYLVDDKGRITQPIGKTVSIHHETSPETKIVAFNDDEKRVTAWKKWKPIRDAWASRQSTINKTRGLFTKIYQLHIDLKRESETLEMVVSAGFICDKSTTDMNHPVLTRRVKTRFDAAQNTIIIEDADVDTELHTMLLQVIPDISLSSIKTLQDELRANDYHPMDRNDTPEYLKRLVHQLSADSLFSPKGQPVAWQKHSRLLLYVNPSFLVRKRVDGTVKAVQQIIENIADTGYVPSHLHDIVSGGQIDVKEDDHEETIEEQLASVGGESIDILLSKEANKEQLEIAQRIEKYNAVLVQGPPGTGKTHTIANLMGHFLAQGKSVLVTSHTKKALSVLKEKVVPGLQNLCVSVLDDSNVDMERSIDGITEYMGKCTAYELKKDREKAGQERKKIIADLADTRKKLFAIINRECNSIVLNGEEISPAKAATYILDHAEELSYIPGDVQLYSSLPLTTKELSDLYRSNECISASDESELACRLPNPELLISPASFEKSCITLQTEKTKAVNIAASRGWGIAFDAATGVTEFSTSFGSFYVDIPNEPDLSNLEEFIRSFGEIDIWMRHAAVDGKKGGSYRQRWLALIEQIESTCRCADLAVADQFGKRFKLAEGATAEESAALLEKLKSHYEKKGKISKLDLVLNSSLEKALHIVTIDGASPQSAEDCAMVLRSLAVADARKKCAVYWDSLMSEYGVPSFFELDAHEPESIAEKWIPLIQRYLNWYHIDYDLLTKKLSSANISPNVVFPRNSLDSEYTATDKILSTVSDTIPAIIAICKTALAVQRHEDLVFDSVCELEDISRTNSILCREMAQALSAGNPSEYAEKYGLLVTLFAKYTLLQSRKESIQKIAAVAPQWAEAISRREGIHGSFAMPSDIEDAWKWKQYFGIIAEMTSDPYDALQAKSLSLSKKYRSITAKYAELSAWYHLLRRTERDIDMKQALQGWKLTVKRIGKGTGKNAPMYRAQARQLMAKCQMAVPAWIMPINKALETLDPKTNKFDVVIIDEASQSDITALAITYMAKKLIIVGDDKQVSPMAVGVEVDKTNQLVEQHIKDVIPNSHLFNAKTSLYEIALTTYHPLMLREHFRCVPEIIGFSNALSYDFKIKPLRDAGSSEITPAVVNFRVADGKRVNKENVVEAMNIVALIQACIDQPEYRNKTFGVISLLGDEQARRIQTLLSEHINVAEIESRHILCGNASNFQGDERDIIFLSLVDSHSDDGPLSLMGFGVDDAFRKRYNVAVSRARDQLWVVDSLDSANDLKPEDIRKRLIDYSLNPTAIDNMLERIEIESESPFELAVASTLASRGYHLVQQWRVGGYRIDMVAMCGKKKVAIECDGEKYHQDVRADMERQAILERLGWRFIRIRGSEYYRNPEKTMERVVNELSSFGIAPEAHDETVEIRKDSELLQRVKIRAAELLSSYRKGKDAPIDIETILTGLGSSVFNLVEPPKTVAPVDAPKKLASPKEEKLPVLEKPKSASPKQEKPRQASSVKPHERKPAKSAPSPAPSKPEKPIRTIDKKPVMKKGDAFISELEKANLTYIDNRGQSGIVWVLYSAEAKTVVEALAAKHKYRIGLEKRGSIATNNYPAWRIVI